MQPLDGPATDLRRTLAPDHCDGATNDRAFALLVLAAAECACRRWDVVDLRQDEETAEKWSALMGVLLQAAHWATPDAGQENERGINWKDYLKAVWEAPFECEWDGSE